MAELKKDKLNMKSLARDYGITASYLKSDKSLQDVLKKIINQDITDPERMQKMIENTDWWKNYSNSLRQYMFAKQTNPGEFAKNLESAKQSVLSKATALGIDIDEETAADWADMLLRGSTKTDKTGKVITYDEAWLADRLAGAIDFTKTKTVGGIKILDVGGSIGTAVDEIYAIARDYGIDTTMSNEGFNQWMQQTVTGLVSGDMAKDDIDQSIKEMSMNNFPGFAEQIRQGYTLRNAAASQLSSVSKELELDLDTLDLNDNVVQQVLNFQDKSGAYKPMTGYEARKVARKDNRWQFTENAKNEYQNIAGKILQDFGFGG
jgi:hypothetical protein